MKKLLQYNNGSGVSNEQGFFLVNKVSGISTKEWPHMKKCSPVNSKSDISDGQGVGTEMNKGVSPEQ